MSAHYSMEPAPTASATLNTPFGPIHIALFAKQTPLTCKNFLQHCQDGYYTGTIFHRVVPDFVIQGGDPTGTGSGGTSIYEYPEFEYDPEARDPNEKVVLKDELHSRLRFNRRGLLGMAKSEDGSYGSQFFITLANSERELNGQCTLFGRVEGDSIFNVLKIAEAERIEDSERPVYPVKVTSCEVGELGPLAGKLLDRQLTAPRVSMTKEEEQKQASLKKKKKKAGKAGKALLSFGGDEGDEDLPDLPTKPKFNTKLVADTNIPGDGDHNKKTAETKARKKEEEKDPESSRKRTRSPSASIDQNHHKEPRRRGPKSPDPLDQLPLVDPEVPSRSPPRQPQPQPQSQPLSSTSPHPTAKPSIISRTNAEIDSLKASMRRNDTTHTTDDKNHKKSALEAMIPETAIRGRKRPTSTTVPRGSTTTTTTTNGVTGFSSTSDKDALRLFNDFKTKLENAHAQSKTNNQPTPDRRSKQSDEVGRRDQERKQHSTQPEHATVDAVAEEEDNLCDLHFVANCQSCRSWNETANNNANSDTISNNNNNNNNSGENDDDDEKGWLTHRLHFGKDMLGKDLSWKKEHPDDADSLVVIDPREREKEILGKENEKGKKKKGFERDRERERKKERVGEMEWERAG